jgi:hypothetical protein
MHVKQKLFAKQNVRPRKMVFLQGLRGSRFIIMMNGFTV